MPERPAAYHSLALDRPLLPIAVRRALLVFASLLLACFCWLMLDEGDSLNAQEKSAPAAAAQGAQLKSAELKPAPPAAAPRN
jgi:hypothetical protein